MYENMLDFYYFYLSLTHLLLTENVIRLFLLWSISI